MRTLITGRVSCWLRGMVWCSMPAALATLAVGLLIAAVREEQPFQRGKLVSHETMDFIAGFGIPVSAGLGGIVGIGLAELMWRKRNRTTA